MLIIDEAKVMFNFNYGDLKMNGKELMAAIKAKQTEVKAMRAALKDMRARSKTERVAAKEARAKTKADKKAVKEANKTAMIKRAEDRLAKLKAEALGAVGSKAMRQARKPGKVTVIAA